MILEAFGGISTHSLHFIRRLALCGRKGRARATAPSTEGRARAPSRSSYFAHHTQQLAAAAQVGDAKGIWKKITEMKICLIKVALNLKATGRG